MGADMPMMPGAVASPVGLLISGGLDSSILLGHLLRQGAKVQPFYIRSGLYWQRYELQALHEFLGQLASPALRPLVILELPLADLYQDHWSVTGRNCPITGTPDAEVYLPGRNALLVIKAALWCQLHGIEQLALAPLGSSPFADASNAFFDDFQKALNRTTAGHVQLRCPFSGLGKQQVMQLGRDYPLQLTFSCIAPVDGLHCGRCNKCGERQAAFQGADIDDPTRYAIVTSRLRRPAASWPAIFPTNSPLFRSGQMFRVTREIDFCYGHRLLQYQGKCRYLHGHNGRVVIAIESPRLDERGMVLDFSDIKRVVSQWIDENLDHRMLLRHDDPAVPVLRALGEPVHVMDENPTAENIAKLIFDFTAAQGFPVVETRLWETPHCFATYQAHDSR